MITRNITANRISVRRFNSSYKQDKEAITQAREQIAKGDVQSNPVFKKKLING